MAAAVRILMSLLLIGNLSKAHSPLDESPHSSLWVAFSLSPQSLVSLLMLGLTIVLSSLVYLWVLGYICIGCCQPVPVGTESDSLAEMV